MRYRGQIDAEAKKLCERFSVVAKTMAKSAPAVSPAVCSAFRNSYIEIYAHAYYILRKPALLG